MSTEKQKLNSRLAIPQSNPIPANLQFNPRPASPQFYPRPVGPSSYDLADFANALATDSANYVTGGVPASRVPQFDPQGRPLFADPGVITHRTVYPNPAEVLQPPEQTSHFSLRYIQPVPPGDIPAVPVGRKVDPYKENRSDYLAGLLGDQKYGEFTARPNFDPLVLGGIDRGTALAMAPNDVGDVYGDALKIRQAQNQALQQDFTNRSAQVTQADLLDQSESAQATGTQNRKTADLAQQLSRLNIENYMAPADKEVLSAAIKNKFDQASKAKEGKEKFYLDAVKTWAKSIPKEVVPADGTIQGLSSLLESGATAGVRTDELTTLAREGLKYLVANNYGELAAFDNVPTAAPLSALDYIKAGN